MDEQALLGLNPNADARYRQRVSEWTWVLARVAAAGCGSAAGVGS